MLQREGVTDTRWTKATFTHGERKSGQELLRGGGGGDQGARPHSLSPTSPFPHLPGGRHQPGYHNAEPRGRTDAISTQWGKSYSGSPFLPEATGGRYQLCLGKRQGGCAGEVREGDLDPGHFRQRGEKARGGVWVLAWGVMEEGAGLRGDGGET